jgi:uncharacterized protein YnzC (UPF0291/DUF896 family)
LSENNATIKIYINIGVFILDQKKIDRINELARKSKSIGLTEAEKAEQTELRNEYRRAVTGNLAAQLENTYVITSDGKKHKVGKSR